MSQNDVVLVRIYGSKSDLLIDREREIKAVAILNTKDCAAPIFCLFENGMAYGYASGIMINVDVARQPLVQRYFSVSE